MGRLPSRLLWGWSLVDVQLLPLKDLPGASPLTQAMLLRPLMVGLAHFLLFYPPWSGRVRRLPCSVLLRLCFVFLHGVWIQVIPSFLRPGPLVGSQRGYVPCLSLWGL